jgi:copper(I)-binding protein
MKYTSVIIGTALSLFATVSAAEDYTAGAIRIGNPWARATPKGSTIGAAYLTLSNSGTVPDRLIGGSVTVAGRFEVHSMTMEDGVAKMRPVEGGLEIPPGAVVALEPGSYHVMLVGLTQPLQAKQRIKGTLVFERAGKVDVEFAVQPIGGGPPASGTDPHAGH